MKDLELAVLGVEEMNENEKKGSILILVFCCFAIMLEALSFGELITFTYLLKKGLSLFIIISAFVIYYKLNKKVKIA